MSFFRILGVLALAAGFVSSSCAKPPMCKTAQKKKSARSSLNHTEIDGYVAKHKLASDHADSWLWFFVLNVQRGCNRIGYSLVVTLDEKRDRGCVKIKPQLPDLSPMCRKHTACGKIRSVKEFARRLEVVRASFRQNKRYFFALKKGLMWYWDNAWYHYYKGHDLRCSYETNQCCIDGCEEKGCCKKLTQIDVALFDEITGQIRRSKFRNPFVPKH